MTKNQHSMLSYKLGKAITHLSKNPIGHNTREKELLSIPPEEFVGMWDDPSPWTPIILGALQKWILDAEGHQPQPLSFSAEDLHEFFEAKRIAFCSYDKATMSAFGDPQNWPPVDAQIAWLVYTLADSKKSDEDKLTALDKLYDDWQVAKNESGLLSKISIEGFEEDSCKAHNLTLSLIDNPLTLEHPKALKILARITWWYGDISLPYAVACTTPEMTRALIESGADINNVDGVGDSVINTYCSRGALKSPEILRLLIENKANIEAKDSRGQTPLMQLTSRTFKDAGLEGFQLLIDSRADVNATDKRGDSILGNTIFSYYEALSPSGPIGYQMAKTLVEHGAQIDAKDTNVNYFKFLIERAPKTPEAPDMAALVRSCLANSFRNVETKFHTPADSATKSDDALGDGSASSAATSNVLELKEDSNVPVESYHAQLPTPLSSEHRSISEAPSLTNKAAEVAASSPPPSAALVATSTPKTKLPSQPKVLTIDELTKKITATTLMPQKMGSVSSIINMQDSNGETPLTTTIKGYSHNPKFSIDIINALIKNGAEVTVRNKGGELPLYVALDEFVAQEVFSALLKTKLVEEPHKPVLAHALATGAPIEVIGELIAAGAKVNFTTGYGDSTLAHAIEHNASAEVLDLLINKGANKDGTSGHGHKILTHAINHYSDKISRQWVSDNLSDQQSMRDIKHRASSVIQMLIARGITGNEEDLKLAQKILSDCVPHLSKSAEEIHEPAVHDNSANPQNASASAYSNVDEMPSVLIGDDDYIS